jgi:hypothetical protein
MVPDASIAITKIGGLTAALDGKASAADIETLTRKYDGKQDQIADGSLSIAYTADLQRQLDDINEIRRAHQAQITGVYLALDYTKRDLADLVIAVSDRPSTTEFNEQLLTRATVSSLVQGLATRQEKLSSFSDLDVASIKVSALTAGATVINAGDADVSLIAGNSDSYLRLKHGCLLDSYNRDGTGRDISLCQHTQSAVRIASKLSIGMAASNFQLQVAGAANLTSFIEATKFQITSDQRLKENVQAASFDECTRLVTAVHPVTYSLKSNDEAQLGYLAQAWDRELTGGYRCVMGASEDADGPLLALDYSRVVPILHGALLSALKRIDALESRM